MAQTPIARSAMIEDFEIQPEARCGFFTDQVMGGALIGQMHCAGWFRHRPTLDGGEVRMGIDQEAKSAKAESSAVTEAA
jgi:hypothetical protein